MIDIIDNAEIPDESVEATLRQLVDTKRQCLVFSMIHSDAYDNL